MNQTVFHSESPRPAQAAALLGIGIATLWRWAKERPDFPRPRRLSARCTVFDRDELVAWRDGQMSGAPQTVEKPVVACCTGIGTQHATNAA
jgi:prophage regulatory protein